MQYYEHAYNMAPLAVQRILEHLVKSDTWPVYSPFAKEHFGRGKAEGIAETRAEDVLTVLGARNLDLTDAERERITGCTDLRQLETWVGRAVIVEKTSDLFG
jgi:hypothetical protein